MSANGFRTLLLSLCAALFAGSLYSLYASVSTIGVVDFSIHRTAQPLMYRLGAPRGTAAYESGLRDGDLVDAATMTPSARYRLFTAVWPLTRNVDLTVRRASRTVRVPLAMHHPPFGWDAWLATLGAYWMLFFAVLIAAKCSGSVEARVLCLWLLLVNCNNLDSQNWLTPFAPLDALLNVFGVCAINASAALLATFAMLFARPPNRIRRVFMWSSYAAAAAGSLLYVVAWAARWFGVADLAYEKVFWIAALIWLLPLVCAAFSFAQARGSERTRLGWAGGSLGVFYVALILLLIGNFISSASIQSILGAGVNASVFCAPIGLTYALLNRRLLDVGFALNRAAVFSVVSIVIVGAFVLVEWALSDWFAKAGHSANIAVNAMLALVLGLSVRAIHKRVDGLVDTVFFRKRHEDEKAIRIFARTCTYITDTATLLQRAASTLEQHADASFVNFALDDGAGHYGDVSENDCAIVALRAEGKIVDLHTTESALSGEFAYPMIARGRLVAALVLGRKRSGESYAPDEADAIAQLAHNAGTALDMLREDTEKRDEFAAAIALLTAKLDSMPGKLAAELSLRDLKSVRHSAPESPPAIS